MPSTQHATPYPTHTANQRCGDDELQAFPLHRITTSAGKHRDSHGARTAHSRIAAGPSQMHACTKSITVKLVITHCRAQSHNTHANATGSLDSLPFAREGTQRIEAAIIDT
jgi:hypothetical protein